MLIQLQLNKVSLLKPRKFKKKLINAMRAHTHKYTVFLVLIIGHFNSVLKSKESCKRNSVRTCRQLTRALWPAMSWSSSVCTLVLLRTSKSSVSKSESSNSSGVWGQRGEKGWARHNTSMQVKNSTGMCCNWFCLTHSQVLNVKPRYKYSITTV